MTNLEKVLTNVDKSLLVSNQGSRKENIYKKDIFADCITDRDKKTIRRKLRNILDNYVKSILICKDSAKLKKLCIDFNTYYLGVYNVNDYSLQSIASNNVDESKKENLIKFLQIVQKNISVSSSSKKSNTKRETKPKTKKEEIKEEVNNTNNENK